MTKQKPKSELKAYRDTQSYLTDEQISILSKNPNIIKVTPRQVHYTQTFKDYFCREYAKGRSSTDILREQGIDPKVLGETRATSSISRKTNRFSKKIFAHDYLKQTPHKSSQKS